MTRTALVSGTTRGIGAAIATRLLQEQFEVIGMARSAATIEHPRYHHCCQDLADIEALPERLQRLLATHAIDTLVLNAGAGHIGTLETFNARQIQASMTLNLISPLVLCRMCIPVLRTRARSDIVLIGSESALAGKRQGTLYSAAKFGLRGAAQALRDELAGSNCHVGIVQPGMVRSDFFQHLHFEPGPARAHALDPEDVAAATWQMLAAADHAVIEELVVKPRQHVVQKRTHSQPGVGDA